MISLDNIKLPLIAILRGIKPEEVLEHAKALFTIGFRFIEIPTNSPEWLKSVDILQKHFNGKVFIGAGTVITQQQLFELIALDAKLMVSPNFNVDILTESIAHDMISCVGALSPTEVITASQAGATIVKVFPAGGMGLNYCKAIMAVAPKKQLYYCVGGITPENLSDYLKLGFHGAGLGGDLYKPNQSVKQTSEKALQFYNAYLNYRDENHRN